MPPFIPTIGNSFRKRKLFAQTSLLCAKKILPLHMEIKIVQWKEYQVLTLT